MVIDSIKRPLVNNKSCLWWVLHLSKHFSICEINPHASFRGCLVKNHGHNNRIIVEEGAKINFCTFSLSGDNNIVYIGKNACLSDCVFLISDHGNSVRIGENTTVTRNNLESFKQIFELCERIGAVAWHIFLLVPMEFLRFGFIWILFGFSGLFYLSARIMQKMLLPLESLSKDRIIVKISK